MLVNLNKPARTPDLSLYRLNVTVPEAPKVFENFPYYFLFTFTFFLFENIVSYTIVDIYQQHRTDRRWSCETNVLIVNTNVQNTYINTYSSWPPFQNKFYKLTPESLFKKRLIFAYFPSGDLKKHRKISEKLQVYLFASSSLLPV